MMLFDEYLFADYSGAFHVRAQRKAIRLAVGTGRFAPSIVQRRLTRDDLAQEFVCRLRDAVRRGVRVCFGQDHQYGVPFQLADDLGLACLDWRGILDGLATGGYGNDAPRLTHPRTFARSFNEWLVGQGQKPYFYSATKAKLYGVPTRNPRDGDSSCYRLTERRQSESGAGAPKAFNRIGDNGSVGGQSLVGMLAIRNLRRACARENIKVAVWPFDGLSITDPAYDGAHVMVEPYPSAVRSNGIPQSDDSDALACVIHLRSADLNGQLPALLDLSGIGSADAAAVAIEG